MTSPDITLFWIAFFAYLAGFILYSLYLAFKNALFAKLGLLAEFLGFLPQTAAFIVRWLLVQHVPLSNMYEYMGLMSWMAALSLFFIIWRYRRPIFGCFISPVVFMLMVTASLLPKDITQALMPALQSYWLTIHVSLAALGSGSFAVACAVSFVYLLKASAEAKNGFFSPRGSSSIALKSALFFPLIFTILTKIIGLLPNSSVMQISFAGLKIVGLGWLFIGLGLSLPFASLLWYFSYKYRVKLYKTENNGVGIFKVIVLTVLLSSLIEGFLIKFQSVILSNESPWKIWEFFGIVWIISVPLFFPLYWLMVKLASSFFSSANINTELLDEINYKTVCLGYPLYTVGALFAGAIWAEQAWGQFWSWDPKEVGALVIWLFYTGFLHAHRQYGWRGNKAAILSVFGLLMILLSFFGNYFFGGQHAYA